MDPMVSDSIAKGEAVRRVLGCDAVFVDVLIGVVIGIVLTLVYLKLARE